METTFGRQTSHVPDDGLPHAREAGLASRAQWGAIFAGAFCGFAAAIVLTTFGAALGITAAGQALEHGAEPGKTVAGMGIGAAAWILISAVIVGVVGGSVLKSLARQDGSYRPALFATTTWALGLALAAMVGAGVLGLGGGAAAGAPQAVDAARRATGAPVDASVPRSRLGDEHIDDEEAANAAKAAAGLAWLALAGQLIGLGATILAASPHRARAHKTQEVRAAI